MQLIVPYSNKPFVPYVLGNKLFSDDELRQLKERTLAEAKDEATVDDQKTTTTAVRRAQISWIDDDSLFANRFVFERLAGFVASINNRTFHFDLTCIAERIQLAAYWAEDRGHYDWHQDHLGSEISRKLTLIVQLSEGAEYDGGHLEVHLGAEIKTMPKDRGTVILFPSYQLHRVTPVMDGVRCSLTTWVSGPSFR